MGKTLHGEDTRQAEADTGGNQPKRINIHILGEVEEGAILIDNDTACCTEFWGDYDASVLAAWRAVESGNPKAIADRKMRYEAVVAIFYEWATDDRADLRELALYQELPSFLAEIRGKDLVTRMPEGFACMTDVLLELANDDRLPRLSVEWQWDAVPAFAKGN